MEKAEINPFLSTRTALIATSISLIHVTKHCIRNIFYENKYNNINIISIIITSECVYSQFGSTISLVRASGSIRKDNY